MRKLIAISGAALMAASFAASAAHAGVVNCDADGNRQRNGAIIGGIAGAIIGNNVSHKAGAPIVGGLAGAAAGSAIGCNQQKMMARDKANASYIGNSVATANIAIRAKPSSRSDRIGSLRKGEHAEVLRYEGDWAVIGYKGNYGSRTTGYVSAAYLREAR
jgi:uncharacterized protein YgiM (DUF1202 family)